MNERKATGALGEFTVLDLDDRRTPPVFVWLGSIEESLRPVPTEVVKEYATWTYLSPKFRAAAVAELTRRGISAPEA
jgi:hypothetical protein